MIAPYAKAEGAAIIVIGGAATAVAAWLAGWWALAPALLAAALLAFYRDPPRAIPRRPDALLAPADGRVMSVEQANGEIRIAIFLSVFNVHVNRAPCAGRVTDVTYTPGKFLNALKTEATQVNERSDLTLSPAPPIPGPIHVRQISGAIARRIVCAARPGEQLAAGQRFGMIKLGSQTDLRAPDDGGWRILVSRGDSVVGGRTMLLERATPS